MTRGFSASSPACQRADRRADPAQDAIGAERDVAIGRGRETIGARLELGGKRLLRGSPDRLAVLAGSALVGGEAEALQLADMVAFDHHRAGWAYFGFKHRIFPEAPHKDGSPAVYEAFRQPLMQRIRQSVFDFARLFLPVCRIGKPSRPVRHESPGADLRDALRQRVDVALGGVGAAHLLGHVVLVDMPLAGEVVIHRGDQVGVLGRRDPAVVGQGAGFPEQRDALASDGKVADDRIARQMVERLLIDGGQRARQPFDGRRRLDRTLERVEARKIEADGAPLQHLHRIEVVRLDLLDQLFVERIDLAGHAESAVAQMASGAAGDLAELGSGEVAVLVAVELAVLREGDMVEVEIEAHADRIGGDEVVDVARLVERDLGVAGARRRARRARRRRRRAGGAPARRWRRPRRPRRRRSPSGWAGG